MKFTNGALVHQVWDFGATDLVATFQYVSDADLFCSADRDRRNGWKHVRTCMSSGEMRVFDDRERNANEPALVQNSAKQDAAE